MNHGNNEPYWMVKTGNYVLIYNITYSMNPHFTEYELWEYGIECCLYNLKDELISSAHVSHISPELDKVNEMIRICVNQQVFPVHLTEIISDLLEKTDEDELSKLANPTT